MNQQTEYVNAVISSKDDQIESLTAQMEQLATKMARFGTENTFGGQTEGAGQVKGKSGPSTFLVADLKAKLEAFETS